jgi:predicted RND superfamily exporter protein
MGVPRSLTRRHPRIVLAAFVVLTLALGAAAPFTRWDASPELLTIEGSPELAAYRDYLASFGSDELLVIAFEHPDLLGPSGLATVRSLTDALFEVEGVEDVSSLDTAYDVAFGPFGPFAEPLVPDALESAPDCLAASSQRSTSAPQVTTVSCAPLRTMRAWPKGMT